MNRSTVVVLVIALLTVQGSVAGVIAGGGASAQVENNTTSDEVTTTTTDGATETSVTAEASAVSADTETDGTSSPSEATTTTGETTSETQTETQTETETETATETETETSTETETEAQTATETETETQTEIESSDETQTEASTDTSASETSTQSPQTSPEGTTPSLPAGGGAPSSDTGAPSGGAASSGGSSPDAGAGGGATPPAGAGAAPSAPSAGTSSASGGAPSAAPSGAAGGAAGATGQVPPGAGAAPSGGAPSGAAPTGAPPAGAAAGGAPSAPSGAGAGGAGAGAAAGSSGASPDAEFEIQSVSSDVAVGEPGTVTVTIENTGEDATNAVVNLQSLSGDLLFGESPDTSRFVGDWEEGETKTLDLTMRAAPTADAAEYPVQATISYEDDDGNQSQSAPISFGVTLDEPSADLSVESVSSDVPVGGNGNVSVTLENNDEDATDAVVNLQSLSGDLLFGQTPNTSRYVGDWEEGENKTIEVTMQAAPTADTSEYPVQASVSYEDDDGNSAQLGPTTFGVTPDGEQQFTLGGVDGDLAVGETGTISGTVTNEGPKQAADAVLAFSPNGSRDIVPRQSQYVLGDLDEDESESFELPVLVNGTAEPGERQVPFVVQYYDSDGNPLQSKPLNTQVDIDAESDDFEITDVATDVEAGEQGTLSVTMNNTGENVTDTTVSFQSLSSGILFGESANASQFVADWDTGEQRTFEFDVTAADSTTGGNYPMQASLTYDDADGDQAQSGPFAFGVEPNESQDDFTVVSSSAEVQVGDEGPVSVTLENTGENVSEATISLQSLTGDILFGQTANATQFVGEWPAGSERTVTFNATASNNTETRSYPLQTSVSYKDSNGDAGQSDSFTLGITPQPEQSFTLSNTNSTLAVGDEGNVTGTITNQGPQDAQNAVVTLVSESENIEPQSTEVALGSLPAGGTANFSIPIEVTDSAEPGPQQFSFVVEYDNQNGDTRRSGTLDTQVMVEPQSDEFIVERANASLDVGTSGTVTLNVTNNRASAVSNVNAKAFVDDPLSISSDEAYIAQLEPGETQQIAFDVSSGGDASAGEYPLSVDFQYDSGGESKLSDTYEVPVELVASDDGGILSSLSVMWGLGGLLVLFGVGWVWSRR